MNGGNAVNMLKQAEALLKDREDVVQTAKKVAKKLAIDTVAQLYKALGACEGMFRDARKPLSERLQEWTLENSTPEPVTETETVKGVELEKESVRYRAHSRKWKYSLTEYDRFNVDSFKKNSPVAYRDAMKTHSTKARAFRVDPR